MEQIRKFVEEAGFEVREYGRQADLGVVVNGQVRGFYISQAVVDLLGDHGKSLYHGWSGSAHHAPWALAPWTSMRFAEDGSGIHLSTYHFEDKHVELAADVADILAAAGRARDTFFGRSTSTAIDTCVDVAAHLRDQIPAIRERLGRPDGDPTRG